MTVPALLMSFDVESVGLHGEGYAVGWVVFIQGTEAGSGYVSCPSSAARGTDEDRAWIAEHVDPHLPEPRWTTPRAVRDAFWSIWTVWRAQGAILVADCAWPVEARFLAACVDDDPARRAEGPYPLHDVASILLSAGWDPLATYPRRPGELPAHHPTNDARQSGRLALVALSQIRRR